MTPRRGARCRSNMQIYAKTDGKQEDPFLFRPPICPPAACFFFLSSPPLSPRLDILLSSSSSPPSFYPTPSNKKQYLPPFSLRWPIQLPEELFPRLTHRTVQFHCFQTTTAPAQSLHLLRTSLFSASSCLTQSLDRGHLSVWFSNLGIAATYIRLLGFRLGDPTVQGFISCQVYRCLQGTPTSSIS